MNRNVWRIGACITVGLLAAAWPARAAGVEDFKLAKAIPADAMIFTAGRTTEGMKFLNEQKQRVWAAVERQHFEKDIKRLMRAAMSESGQTPEQFDEQWQKLTDLAANVNWSQLSGRESAFALKIGGPPTFVEFVLLLMPPADEVAKDFEGLTAMAKHLATLAPEGKLTYSSEGEGDSMLARVTASGDVPLALTLARQKDALLIGFGTGLIEQSLGLLRGQTGSTLIGSERFKQAVQRLPAPKEAVYFVDVARIMAECRNLSNMFLEKAGAAEGASEQLGWVKPLLAQFDVWDYVAGTADTDGMKGTAVNVTAIRDAAKDLPLYKAFYAGKALQDALKYVPQDATGVNALSGFDVAALYQGVLDFIRKNAPEGEQTLEQWKGVQQEAQFDVEKDLLAWLGSSLVTFSTARGAYASDSVYMFDVRDEAAARKTLDGLAERFAPLLEEQKGALEDANIEGAEGFKTIVPPAAVALMLPMSQPTYGIKDGRFFFATSTKVLELALQTGAAKHDNFTKSAAFKDGLPLPESARGYSFADLTKFGEQLNAQLNMALMPLQLMGGGAKDPAMTSVLSMIRKFGLVMKSVDFLKSTYNVTTFDGKASLSKSLTYFQEPKPAKAESSPADEPAPAGAEKKPAAPEKKPAGGTPAPAGK